MTLVIQKTAGSNLVLRNTSQPLDADAQAYVNAVEVADGQRIEDPVRFAINNFVIGCKADGIWTAIKASCILAGARTRQGALVPLVGAAPQSFNFVDANYNRKTGLVGNGTNAYIDANRSNNADPQNNKHLSIYLSSTVFVNGVNKVYIGAQSLNTLGGSGIYTSGATSTVLGIKLNGQAASTGSYNQAGFIAVARSSSSQISIRAVGSSTTASQTSASPVNVATHIFRSSLEGNESAARIAFYSIGEALDLALLDARVTALINAIGAAIP